MLSDKTTRFTALTPLWTGDTDRKSDLQTLETGVLGSLRWWTEVLVRGMGVSAEGEGNPVDLIFGSTQLRRRFRLLVEGGKSFPFSNRGRFELPIGRRPTWQFPSDARHGDMTLRLIGATPLAEAVVHGVLAFASAVGALGARSQHGCGIVRLCEKVKTKQEFQAWLGSLWQHGSQTGSDQGLPSLRNLFAAEYVPNEERDLKNMLDTFYARYYLRDEFRKRSNEVGLRHFLFGSARDGDRQGSKVCVSFPFDAGNGLRMRVWGWIPEDGNRAQHLSRIRTVMDEHFKESSWVDLANWYRSPVPR